MNKLVVIICALNALCAITFIIITLIFIPTFNPSYYSHEYDKYNIPESVGMSKDDLMDVTDHMLEYMHGDNYNLQIETTINGETQNFFNDQELTHMSDVQDIFESLRLLLLLSIEVFIVTAVCIFLLRVKVSKIIAKCYLIVPAIVLAVTSIIGVFALIDFDDFFTILHKLFFDNNLWIFDASTSNLVNIVPQPFFVDICSLVLISIVIAMLLIVVLSALFLRYYKKKNKTLLA